MRGRSSWTTFAFERGPSTVALDVHLDDGGVVDEAIDGGERHGGVREDLVPFAEWLIGRDQHRASLVACADEFEQHAGLGLVLGDVGQIVKNEKIEAIEAVDGRLEIELAPRHLELLDEIGGAGAERRPYSTDRDVEKPGSAAVLGSTSALRRPASYVTSARSSSCPVVRLHPPHFSSGCARAGLR